MRTSFETASTSCGPLFLACIIAFCIFFYGKDAVALSHGITKEREVPNSDIDIAIARMKETKASPDKFTADIELER
jgi:hypothetical protein